MRNRALIEQLSNAGDRVAEHVIADMCTNPFWFARFGERAIRRGREDNRYHIAYLVQALAVDDMGILENYARWLQSLLTARGMCSRHLAENFDRLGQAIAGEHWHDGARAVEMLDAATRALQYPGGPARVLQERSSMLARATVDILQDRHPDWMRRDGRAHCVEDLEYHLSYASDAIAARAPGRYVAYVQWVTAFLESHHVPRAHVLEALDVLAALAQSTAELREIVANARGHLAERSHHVGL